MFLTNPSLRLLRRCSPPSSLSASASPRRYSRMSSYFTLGPHQTGEKYWPRRLPVTPISGPLPQPNSINYANTSSFAGLKSEFSLWEEDISRGIRRWRDILAHDPEKLKKFKEENKLPRPHADLVHQKWGFVVVRTDYSKESDDLMPGVMEKMHRWMMADLDGVLEPGVVLSTEQREKMSKSFINLLLDDKAVYDGLELRDVYVYFKGFLRTHELDWAIAVGYEEPYVDWDAHRSQPREYNWRNETHSCCNPQCLHPSHHHPRVVYPVIDEATKARNEKIREAKYEAEVRKSYGRPFYLHPEILEQARAETDLRKKWALMKEAEWKLSPQACLVLDLEAMRSIATCDVDPHKYADLDSDFAGKGPFINIVLEDKLDMEYDEGWESTSCDPKVYGSQRMGRLGIVNNPFAMVYTQMAEESAHEFDVTQSPAFLGHTEVDIRSQEEGYGGGMGNSHGYPELQSVIERERAQDNPFRAEKDGDHEKAERLHAEVRARLEKWSRERTPAEEERAKASEKRQTESPEEIEYQKRWFGTELPSEESNYEAAWKEWANPDSKE